MLTNNFGHGAPSANDSDSPSSAPNSIIRYIKLYVDVRLFREKHVDDPFN